MAHVLPFDTSHVTLPTGANRSLRFLSLTTGCEQAHDVIILCGRSALVRCGWPSGRFRGFKASPGVAEKLARAVIDFEREWKSVRRCSLLYVIKSFRNQRDSRGKGLPGRIARAAPGNPQEARESAPISQLFRPISVSPRGDCSGLHSGPLFWHHFRCGAAAKLGPGLPRSHREPNLRR